MKNKLQPLNGQMHQTFIELWECVHTHCVTCIMLLFYIESTAAATRTPTNTAGGTNAGDNNGGNSFAIVLGVVIGVTLVTLLNTAYIIVTPRSDVSLIRIVLHLCNIN